MIALLTVVFQVVLVVINIFNQKNQELKKAQKDLLDEWQKVHNSNDVGTINAFLQRVRNDDKAT